jgi:hypothetical protein
MSVEQLGFGVRRYGFVPAALALLIVAGYLLNACSTSPASPSQPFFPTTGKPLDMGMVDWSYGTSVTTCRLVASWTVHYDTSRDVTDEATWESSDSQVAVVMGKGRIASVSPGDCELRATFQGATAKTHLRVYLGDSPVNLIDCCGISGQVRDASIPGVFQGIEGALVEVIAGHSSGQSTLTDRFGVFTFAPPTICGPITVRASKVGYLDAELSWVQCAVGPYPYVWMTPQ